MKHYYQQYQEGGLAKKKFHGVKLSELDELEKLCEVNIQVYNLTPTHTHGEEQEETEDKPNIAATFVSSGDPKEFITEFIQYLVSISTKSSSLLGEQYAPVFEALETARGPTNKETREDWLAQTLVDMQEGNEESGSGETESEQETGEDSEDESRGTDLMTSDDEEIECENEEDRAFLDDEVNENDPSFYRRLNVQLDTERRQEQRQRHDEIADCEDLLLGEAHTSDSKDSLTSWLRNWMLILMNYPC